MGLADIARHVSHRMPLESRAEDPNELDDVAGNMSWNACQALGGGCNGANTSPQCVVLLNAHTQSDFWKTGAETRAKQFPVMMVGAPIHNARHVIRQIDGHIIHHIQTTCCRELCVSAVMFPVMMDGRNRLKPLAKSSTILMATSSTI